MLGDWARELVESIDRRFEQMVGIRRHLHQNPEVSGAERETSLYLYQLVGDAGLVVQMGPEGRGVIADVPGAVPVPVPEVGALLGLRADIDALRIHDEKHVAYRSRVDGVMHACGHDCHTAILSTVVLVLEELRRRGSLPWPVRVRGIFQPSEETATGAREMIAVGAMEGVEAILALHVDPSLRLGKVGMRYGAMTATCDEIEFHIIGRGGHAARPHEASDPIAAAAQLVSSLYLFIPRVTDSRDAVVVTIGQVVGGHTANVIPEEVFLRGTIRTLTRDVRATTFRHIERLAEGIGRTSDTQIRVRSGSSTHSVVNDANLVDLLRQAVVHVIGHDAVREIERPSMGSEDFAFYLDHAPGAMIRLGCASEHVGGAALHAPSFDVDEEALRIGAAVLAHAAVTWSDPNRRSLAMGEPFVADV
jgi:amidohydrolase